jgi:hypothetical protein
MLNDKQQKVLLAGAGLAALMMLFPPFIDTGGLFGGVRFAFVWLPPAWNPAIDFRPQIASQTLLLQLSAVACFTLSAILAYDEGARRLRRVIFRAGAFTATLFMTAMLAFSITEQGRGWTAPPFLLCLIPLQYPGGYFLFWLRLAFIALVTLLPVSLANRRSRSAVPGGLVFVVGGVAFLLLWFATTAAVRR